MSGLRKSRTWKYSGAGRVTHLKNSKIQKEDKLLVWAVAIIMYAGSLRGSEIWGTKKLEFEEDKMLLNKNINAHEICINEKVVKMILATIKNPKESKGRGTVNIEIIEQGTWMRPVKALEQLRGGRLE